MDSCGDAYRSWSDGKIWKYLKCQFADPTDTAAGLFLLF